VLEALAHLVRERLASKPGGHLIESELSELELALPLALGADEAGRARSAERLVATVDRLLDDALERAAAFRPGHAFCHRCTSSRCEHARPPGSRHIFVGYAPTGVPQWEDFAQFCLELKHPQVDELYQEKPALLALVQGRQALHARLLSAFEHGSYTLLGQLTAGFFSVRAREEEGRGVLALTVQVAAWQGQSGRLRLGINLLGRTPWGDELERLWERHEELPWRRPVRWAQGALETLVRDGHGRSAKPGAALERRVEGILQGLARRLARERRARARRTRHAEERHASGERPTGKALDDARAAAAGALYVDERSGTLVVLGERGRTHFFTPEGRLVSSVRYSREAIERKLKGALWRPAPRELSAAFLSSLPE